ncbi:Hypothetical protein PBC10988_28600 [Planctomycetales bacterium 10988]|nr:Hypothetical protein PBC10988_28600 [Planctomycetales bacterium 10988]
MSMSDDQQMRDPFEYTEPSRPSLLWVLFMVVLVGGLCMFCCCGGLGGLIYYGVQEQQAQVDERLLEADGLWTTGDSIGAADRYRRLIINDGLSWLPEERRQELLTRTIETFAEEEPERDLDIYELFETAEFHEIELDLTSEAALQFQEDYENFDESEDWDDFEDWDVPMEVEEAPEPQAIPPAKEKTSPMDTTSTQQPEQPEEAEIVSTNSNDTEEMEPEVPLGELNFEEQLRRIQERVGSLKPEKEEPSTESKEESSASPSATDRLSLDELRSLTENASKGNSEPEVLSPQTSPRQAKLSAALDRFGIDAQEKLIAFEKLLQAYEFKFPGKPSEAAKMIHTRLLVQAQRSFLALPFSPQENPEAAEFLLTQFKESFPKAQDTAIFKELVVYLDGVSETLGRPPLSEEYAIDLSTVAQDSEQGTSSAPVTYTPTTPEGREKFQRFGRVVRAYEFRLPENASQAAINIQQTIIQQSQNYFLSGAFDPQKDPEAAKAILLLFQTKLEGKYDGQIYEELVSTMEEYRSKISE